MEEDEDDVMAKWDIRYNRRNKGMKADFEQHVRCVLATGATARQAQDTLLLDANYMLPTEDAATLASSLPQIRWFQDQREALGIESYLYVFMRIAAASRVVQVNFKPYITFAQCLNYFLFLILNPNPSLCSGGLMRQPLMASRR